MTKLKRKENVVENEGWKRQEECKKNENHTATIVESRGILKTSAQRKILHKCLRNF
jgi:hypothetical protein